MSDLFELEDNLLLFFTGSSRSASSILKDQKQRTEQSDATMLENLHYVKELGRRSLEAIERGKLALLGELMHEHWEHKKRRSIGMSSPEIDEWYELGRKSGAIGGKLVGAGGGGFLLFYTEEQRRLRTAMAKAGLEEVRFKFDFEGTKVLFG
jgi:D-glycero-alpha-D-manno-heptose-7-phosphate kinase